MNRKGHTFLPNQFQTVGVVPAPDWRQEKNLCHNRHMIIKECKVEITGSGGGETFSVHGILFCFFF